MFALPEVLDNALDFSNGTLKLKTNATDEQKKAFKDFIKEMRVSEKSTEPFTIIHY